MEQSDLADRAELLEQGVERTVQAAAAASSGGTRLRHGAGRDSRARCRRRSSRGCR